MEVEEYNNCIKRSRAMRSLPLRLVTTLQETYEKECEKSAKMYDEINELKYWKDHYEKLYKETNEVLNNTVDFKLKRFKNKIKSTFTSKKNRKFKN